MGHVSIVGAGRSGTSMTARIVAELGIELPDATTVGDQYNPHGYYENDEVTGHHKQALIELGWGYDKPPPFVVTEAELPEELLTVGSWKCPTASFLWPWWVDRDPTRRWVIVRRDLDGFAQSWRRCDWYRTSREPELAHHRFSLALDLLLADVRALTFVVGYEDLVRDTELAVTELADFLGVDVTPSALAVPDAALDHSRVRA